MAIVFRFAGSQTQVLQFLHLRKSRTITSLKSALPKTKNLKTYCNQHLQKKGGKVAHALCRGQRLSESVSRPDEAAGDVI